MRRVHSWCWFLETLPCLFQSLPQLLCEASVDGGGDSHRATFVDVSLHIWRVFCAEVTVVARQVRSFSAVRSPWNRGGRPILLLPAGCLCEQLQPNILDISLKAPILSNGFSALQNSKAFISLIAGALKSNLNKRLSWWKRNHSSSRWDAGLWPAGKSTGEVLAKAFYRSLWSC